MSCILTRAAVVFWQIKTDNLDHIWPIKMLRIIVIITITTLFPTFLELCLDPLDVSTYTALSLLPFFCIFFIHRASLPIFSATSGLMPRPVQQGIVRFACALFGHLISRHPIATFCLFVI